MIEASFIDGDILDCYILNEQPMTCGKCGARTSFEEMMNGTQKHQCLNMNCGCEFVAVEDAD